MEKIKGFEIIPFVTEEEKLEVELLKEKLINLKLEDDVVSSIVSKIEIRNPNIYEQILTKTSLCTSPLSLSGWI